MGRYIQSLFVVAVIFLFLLQLLSLFTSFREYSEDHPSSQRLKTSELIHPSESSSFQLDYNFIIKHKSKLS